MLSVIWNQLLINPILNVLVGIYQVTGSLAISIIILTALIRTVLIPFTLPALKTAKLQRTLQPELDEIKQRYKNDKKKQAEAQMELFKKYGLNPTSGCLTQVLMVVVLIALYRVINDFTHNTDLTLLNSNLYSSFLYFSPGEIMNPKFLWMSLSKPDPYFVLATLSGVLQLLQSKMTLPFTEKGEKAAKQTPDKSDDIAYNMQEQMLYTMPIMNFIIGMSLPSGAVLYIVTGTLYSLVQTYLISGWGGLKSWMLRIGIKVK